MTNNLPILDDKQFASGGYQAIEKICGVFTDMEVILTGSNAKEYEKLVKITLEDAKILRMEEGEPEPELTDGVFTHSWPYLKYGKVRPHQNSPYAKGFYQTGKDVGIFPDNWQGQTKTEGIGEILGRIR